MPNNIDEKKKWTITLGSLNGWGGYCPAYFDNSYPYYGNKNQASVATDVNMIDPNVLTQGPGLLTMTTGSEAGALKTFYPITALLREAASTNVTFGIGGKLLYQLSASVVTSGATFPHTITGSGIIVGCDVLHYKGLILYSYNDSALGGAGVQKGNIGAYNISAITFDDTYWTGTLAGTALEDAPHYMIHGGDDVAYITNGRYIAKLDGTSENHQALDFWQDSVTVALVWNQNRVKIGVNRPNVTGSNFNVSAIYNWDGYSASWEGDPIEVQGEIGALYVKNGVEFIWWKDSTATGGYNLGYIAELRIKILKRYGGSLPNQRQVGEYDGHIAWLSSGKLILWGAKDNDVEIKMFSYMSSKYTTTIGGFTAAFGTPMISSSKSAAFTAATNDTITSAGHGLSNGDTIVVGSSGTLPTGLAVDTVYYIISAATDTFKVSLTLGGSAVDITSTGSGTHTWYRNSIDRAYGYSVSASYKTVAFKVGSVDFISQIDLIMVEFETLSTGAACDFTLTYNKGASTQSLTQIAYSASDSSTRRKILNRSYQVEDLRLDISWANGSATNPVKLRSIEIQGHYVKSN